ncbi:hypothetical protein [Paractinoplanes hotanensis]|uniref:Secreted protein n=1 Tax=Paractinoplanes hotanensis TaxID=2906497 RepID=A0ABT0YGQ1_9ACTN|nr:hypothetical protein [Actinoplanes hotanensis]MCM4084930.1 hypothetical protein [Actinoplanes hotanensis]
MRKTVMRITMGLAVATVGGTALMGSPASAQQVEVETGLTFYQGRFTTPVLHVADPDGSCTAFPPTADSLTGFGTVEQVVAYRTADCTDAAVGLGTLRGFTAGTYHSFQAF